MVDLITFGVEVGVFWLKYRLFRGSRRYGRAVVGMILRNHSTGPMAQCDGISHIFGCRKDGIFYQQWIIGDLAAVSPRARATSLQ
jgi:hypothetical protein